MTCDHQVIVKWKNQYAITNTGDGSIPALRLPGSI